MNASRLINILDLLKSQRRFFTANEIALKLDLSERTVRKEILMFQDECSGSSIIESSNKGYSLNCSETDYLQVLEDLKNLKGSSDECTFRENYIIKRLLLEEQYVKLEEIAQELYISQATINRVFRNVKTRLQACNLQISSKPSYGISVIGSELDKRLCLARCYTDSDEDIRKLTADCKLTEADYYYVARAIEKVTQQNNFSLTKIGKRNLIIHLVYALSRVLNGKYIDYPFVETGATKKEWTVAEKIVGEIERKYRIKFPEVEKDYVCIHLLGKQSKTEHHELTILEQTKSIIEQANRTIQEVLGYDFFKDFELFSMLSRHIGPMIIRLKYGLSIPNPILKEIKIEFQQAYECAVIAADVIKRELNYKTSDEELGYMAIHYNLAIERLKKEQNVRVLLVYEDGIDTVELLKKRIISEYHVLEKDVMIINLQDFSGFDCSSVDYIVSTVEIPNFKNNRIIYVDNAMSEIDIQEQYSFPLHVLFSDDMVFLNQDWDSKEKVINNLCNYMIETYHVEPELTQQVQEREALSSTDIGNLIAIPHPLKRCTNYTFMMVCTLKKAIMWDKKKVKYVFMVVYGNTEVSVCQEINERVIKYLMNPNWILQLGSINCVDELRQILI